MLISQKSQLFKYVVETTFNVPEFLKVVELVTPDSRRIDMVKSFISKQKKLKENESI